MGNLAQDLRFGFRTLSKNPTFTVLAALALALGIGANTAIFTVVNSLLIRPLPFPDPDRLVMVFEEKSITKTDRNVISPANLRDWASRNRVFERIAGFSGGRFSIAADFEPEEVPGQLVTHGFFEVLGVQPALGRTFTQAEDRPGTGSVVILSDKLWRQRFAADPNILNRTITLQGAKATIVGVMPPDFRVTGRLAELWTPFGLDPARDYRATAGRFMLSVARLKPLVTIEQADREISSIAAQLEREHPKFNTGWSTSVVPLKEDTVGQVRLAIYVLLGAVGCVLLIACANVANLLLARAATRGREIAIRASLGAGRGRVIRQLLTESLLLSCIAGVLGFVFALWGVDILVAASPRDLPMRDQIRPDAVALGFSIALSILTGVLFGLAPAFSATKTDLVEALKQGGRGSAGVGGRRLRQALVAAEVALGLVLLVGAGLLIRSFLRLQSVNPGFDASQVLTMRVQVPGTRYQQPEMRARFFEQALSRVRTIPGVESASAVTFLPMTGLVSGTSYRVDGEPEPAPGQFPVTNVSPVDRDYLKVMRIPLLQGRFFDTRDTGTSPRVYVVNDTLARKHFANGDALGRRIRVAMGDDIPGEIIGVVADHRYTSLERAIRPTVYYVHPQLAFGSMYIVIRSPLSPASLARPAAGAIRSIDPEIPVADIQPMDAVIAESIARSRFVTTLLTVFAVFALALAAIGVYGVMSYNVTQRTQEIGVRMSLGAGRADVLRMLLRQGMTVVMLGLGIGVVLALAVSRWMTTLLYLVRPTDPVTFAVVPVLLVLVALLAILIPARRATRVDPMTALRYE